VQVQREKDMNIWNLGLMPDKQAICYHGYEVNGLKFHTQTYNQNRSTINSGVCIKGEWDGSDDQHEYYGILQEVVELHYEGGNKVILFNCDWFDIINGVKVDKKRGLVEVKHSSRLRHYEPFVLACQADQAYYLPYPSTKGDRKNWWVAMKIQRKGQLGLGAETSEEFFQEEQSEGLIPSNEQHVVQGEENAVESADYNNDSPINPELVIEYNEEDDDPYAHEGNVT
jgi:uncharacterized cupin superfamily protein